MARIPTPSSFARLGPMHGRQTRRTPPRNHDSSWRNCKESRANSSDTFLDFQAFSTFTSSICGTPCCRCAHHQRALYRVIHRSRNWEGSGLVTAPSRMGSRTRFASMSRNRFDDRMPGQNRCSECSRRPGAATREGTIQNPRRCRRPDRRPHSDADRRHFDSYLNAVAAAGSVPLHRHNVRAYLNRLADEKNREGNDVVIRANLASDLRAWLGDKLAARQTEAFRRGEPIPARLPSDTLVFVVPTALDKIFNGDLKVADIPKRNVRCRTLDMHALGTTFGTLLGRGGVPSRTAQAAMRHSDPKLTANVYTDPKLLDVQGALDALPSLPLDAGPSSERERARATGADDFGPCAVALPVALKGDNCTKTVVNGDKTKAEPPIAIGPTRLAVSQGLSDDFALVSGVAASGLSVCPEGIEPTTFSSGG